MTTHLLTLNYDSNIVILTSLNLCKFTLFYSFVFVWLQPTFYQTNINATIWVRKNSLMRAHYPLRHAARARHRKTLVQFYLDKRSVVAATSVQYLISHTFVSNIHQNVNFSLFLHREKMTWSCSHHQVTHFSYRVDDLSVCWLLSRGRYYKIFATK